MSIIIVILIIALLLPVAKFIVKRLKRRSFNLKQEYINEISKEFGEEAGKEFGEAYDNICRGVPVGNFSETVGILNIIEKVKRNSGLY